MKRLVPTLLLMMSVLPILIASMWLRPTAFFSGDAGPKYLQEQAFEGKGPWPRSIPYPAHAIDPFYRWIPVSMAVVNGELVSFFPSAYPLTASLISPIFGDRAFRILSALAALVSAWLVGRITLQLGGKPPFILLTAALALSATPLMFYGSCLSEHALMAVPVLGAVALLLQGIEARAAPPWLWFLSGIFVGTAGWIRTEGFIFTALAILPWLTMRNRRGFNASLTLAVGTAAGLVTGATLQRLAIGAWLPIHLVAVFKERHVYSVPFLVARGQTIRNLFVPDPWCGVAIITWLAALFLAVVRPKHRPTRLAGLVAVASALLAAVVVPMARFLQGVRPASAFPVRSATTVWILLSVLPLILSRSRQSGHTQRRTGVVLGAIVIAYVVLFLVGSPVDGGYQWGARIFLPVVLMLTALLMARLQAVDHMTRLERLAVATALAAGICIQLFGMALLFHVTRGNAALQTALTSDTTVGDVILTDTFYVPELGAPIWSSRRFLLLRSDDDIVPVLDGLRTTSVEKWTFASADDVNAGLKQRIMSAASSLGWRLTGTRTLHLPGRQLTLLDFTGRAPHPHLPSAAL